MAAKGVYQLNIERFMHVEQLWITTWWTKSCLSSGTERERNGGSKELNMMNKKVERLRYKEWRKREPACDPRMHLPSIFYNCSSCSGSTGAAAFPSIHWDRDRVNQGRADSLREQEWGKETLKRHSERGKGCERKRGDEEWKKTDKGTCEADGKEAD